MRILVDGREFVAGRRTGIGRFLEGLLAALCEAHADWRITVALHKSCALPASLDPRLGHVYLPHLPELAWPRLAAAYDLFISPYPKLPWFSLPCPAIHTVHDVLYLTHPAYRGNPARRLAARLRLQRALSAARLTWFVSHDSRQACEALIGHALPEARVRYSGLEAQLCPGAPPWQQHDPFFLYVGNGRPHKNLEFLMPLFADDRGPSLVCVGVYPDIEKHLLAAYPGSRSRVCFTGQVDDAALTALYRQATALLLPSSAEGFGFPPLEAMACGTPAIVADIPVLRETTGGAALLCPLDNAPAWQQAMASMLYPDVRGDWVAKGLSRVAPLRAPQGWAAHIADIEGILGWAAERMPEAERI